MRVRPAVLAALTLLTAVIGGVSVLVIGKAAGWVGGTTKNTVVVSVPRTAQAVANQRSLPLNTRPISGGAFVPSRIYKLRAPGNVSSLSVGVVSAIRRSIDSLTAPNYNLVDAIQTDAPINHGNSGGPLFDAQGRVIGINAQIRSDTGAADGVGFAVPINSARRSMLQLIAAGRVSYAYVGIETQDLIPSVATRLGYAVRHGAVVMAVTPNSPGAAAGFHAVSSREQLLGSTFGRG